MGDVLLILNSEEIFELPEHYFVIASYLNFENKSSLGFTLLKQKPLTAHLSCNEPLKHVNTTINSSVAL